MKKYNSKKANQIVDLFRTDTYTVFEICRIVKISKSTLYRWISEYPDFAQAVEDAKEERSQIFVIAAKKSLRRKLEGYDVTETKVVTVPGKKKDANGNTEPAIKEQITIKKHVPADTAAIIFTLTNGDSEHWRNRQSTEVTGKTNPKYWRNRQPKGVMSKTNGDPKNYQTTEATGKYGQNLFTKMSDEELRKKIEELNRDLSKLNQG